MYTTDRLAHAEKVKGRCVVGISISLELWKLTVR